MPSEPEKRIETRLRDYATRRQAEAGGPLELHRANRRLLQDEVARVWGRHPPAPSRSWWQGWLLIWPRLVFATALLALMGFVFWQLQSPLETTQQMAQAEPDPESHLAPIADRPQAVKQGDKNQTAESKPTPPLSVQPRESDTLLATSTGIAPDLSSAPSMAPAPTDAPMRKRDQPAEPARVRAPEPSAPLAANGISASVVAGSSPVVTTAPTPAAPPRDVPPGTRDGRKVFSLAAASEEQAAPLVAPAEQSKLARLNEDADSRRSFGRRNEGAGTENRATESARALAKTKAPLQGVPQVGAVSLADGEPRFGEALNPAGVAERYYFRQVAPLKPMRAVRGAVAKEAVLDSFNVELAGNQVRIIDADGSVYTGRLADQAAGTTVKAKAGEPDERLLPMVASDTNAGRYATRQDVSNLWFTVRGTNHSLKQLVTVDGTLVGDAGGPAFTALPVARTRSSEARRVVSGPRSEGVSLSSATIDFVRFRGKATIGEVREIQVDALRVKP